MQLQRCLRQLSCHGPRWILDRVVPYLVRALTEWADTGLYFSLAGLSKWEGTVDPTIVCKCLKKRRPGGAILLARSAESSSGSFVPLAGYVCSSVASLVFGYG